MDVTVTLTVNGKEKAITTDPGRSLLDVLREDLHLTGTKYGCGEGRCGACSVLMNGERVLSCVTPVAQADKKTITTIEGLDRGDSLGKPLQIRLVALAAGEEVDFDNVKLFHSYERINLYEDMTINFKDYSLIAGSWLEEILWPSP
ncbi:MAG: 2Fe-2S iron-sulfur cluster-binding protein [Sedimentisphaerales bacterium]|nr:2Fe-2S iron-sulfur cluster-binding protein [Sedimentisphaerales bacterium]